MCRCNRLAPFLDAKFAFVFSANIRKSIDTLHCTPFRVRHAQSPSRGGSLWNLCARTAQCWSRVYLRYWPHHLLSCRFNLRSVGCRLSARADNSSSTWYQPQAMPRADITLREQTNDSLLVNQTGMRHMRYEINVEYRVKAEQQYIDYSMVFINTNDVNRQSKPVTALQQL